MSGRLDGKVAMITGAARGMGATEARLFAREGARLVLGDVLDEALAKLASELEGAGHEVLAQRRDVTQEGEWAAFVAAAEARFRRLDVLVNNAGILDMAGIEETSGEAWDRVVAVNQTGVWLGMKAAVPAMRRAGGGSIVNKSSIFGIVGSGGSAAYHATKGAVRLLTKTAALQYAPEAIRVNSVHPGYIDTPMVREAIPEVGEMSDELIAMQVPLGRMGLPEDIAQGVLYLASDESSYVTGAELVIDGGVTAR
jgi:NAD(P)-dependent dehydrogenase (short-subunit alcohol dehydrogenase family)